MVTKDFVFKAELLTEADINQIADCVVRKLLQQVPMLVAGAGKPTEAPIKMPEVCRLLRISDTTARSWMTKGILPFHRKGQRVFFFESEVLRSLEQPLRRKA